MRVQEVVYTIRTLGTDEEGSKRGRPLRAPTHNATQHERYRYPAKVSLHFGQEKLGWADQDE